MYHKGQPKIKSQVNTPTINKRCKICHLLEGTNLFSGRETFLLGVSDHPYTFGVFLGLLPLASTDFTRVWTNKESFLERSNGHASISNPY